MKDRRFSQYLLKKRHNPSPIRKKEEIPANPDNRIDQDYPGYPGGNARDELISPRSLRKKSLKGKP